MKYIGIDYGTKRIGIACSDASGLIAFPYKTIPTNKAAVTQIIAMITAESIEAIVFGRSVATDGSVNSVQKKIQLFVDIICKHTQVPVFFEDERFSSHHSSLAEGGYSGQEKRRQANLKNKAKTSEQSLDARAAATILQRYLDRQNKNQRLE